LWIIANVFIKVCECRFMRLTISPNCRRGRILDRARAVLIGKVRLKKHASVWWGAVLRGDNDWITLGEGSTSGSQLIHTDAASPSYRRSCSRSAIGG